MGKSSGDEQKPLTAGAERGQPASEAMLATPTETGELAQHSEAVRFFSGGKRGAWVAEVSVLIWGDLVGLREPIGLQRQGQQCLR